MPGGYRDSAGDGFGEDDEMAKEEAIRAQAVSNTRRRSFSAESADDAKIRNYKCPVYPKSVDANQKITEALRNNQKMQILGILNLRAEDLGELVGAFQPRTIVQNEDVIRQGDIGDCLYIVEEGNFDIFVARLNDDGSWAAPARVANFGEGSLFGELAIMYTAPRAATVRCATPSARVWSLDREPFQMMLKRCGVQMVEQYSGWLTEVPILKVLNNLEISRLADACETVLFDQGETVMEQGDEGDAFYILEDGTAAAFIDTEHGEEMVKVYERQGDYFGELALINNAPRKASVRTTSDAALLKISKEQFDDLLGPIQDRLKAVSHEYPQYADALASPRKGSKGSNPGIVSM